MRRIARITAPHPVWAKSPVVVGLLRNSWADIRAMKEKMIKVCDETIIMMVTGVFSGVNLRRNKTLRGAWHEYPTSGEQSVCVCTNRWKRCEQPYSWRSLSKARSVPASAEASVYHPGKRKVTKKTTRRQCTHIPHWQGSKRGARRLKNSTPSTTMHSDMVSLKRFKWNDVLNTYHNSVCVSLRDAVHLVIKEIRNK